MRQLEATLAPFDRAGEGALLVAEDLALEQRLGDGRAVDRHEGLRGALAELMDGLRHHLLAGARLAPDQHGRRRRRRLFDDPVDLADGRRVADDAAEAAVLAQLPAQDAHLAQRLLALRGLLQEDLQTLRIDRLGQIVVSAFLDGFDGGFDGALRGQQNDGDVAHLIAQRAQQLQAVHPRHVDIRDDDARTEGGDALQRLLAVGGGVGRHSPTSARARSARTAWRDRPRRRARARRGAASARSEMRSSLFDVEHECQPDAPREDDMPRRECVNTTRPRSRDRASSGEHSTLLVYFLHSFFQCLRKWQISC